MKHREAIQNKSIKDGNKGMEKFKLLVIGQLISSIGSGLTGFGLSIYILALTGSVMSTGIFSICAFLPSILLAPVGGILADRYDRRVMMILGEFFSGLGLFICLISVRSVNPSLVVICTGIGVSSVFTALMEPAFKATITDLVKEEDFAKASGMVQIANSTKLIISPAIAGLLLQITPVSTLIVIDILTFFSTALMIGVVKKGMVSTMREQAHLSFWKDMKEGIAAMHEKSGILAVTMIMTMATFCLGFVQILSKPLILAFAGEGELGILSTVIALGMIAGSIMVSSMKKVKSYVKMLAVGLVGCGIFFALIGVREHLFLVAAFGFIMFAFMPSVQIGAEVLIRKNLTNEVQGRAFGLISFITQMGYIFAYLLAGVLSDYLFEPFMAGGSLFAIKIGKIIGLGTGRGSALLIVIAGLFLVVVGTISYRLKSIKTLEGGLRENETVVKTCSEGL